MGCVSEKQTPSLSEVSSSTSNEISLSELSVIIRKPPPVETIQSSEETRTTNEKKIRSIFLVEYLKMRVKKINY